MIRNPLKNRVDAILVVYNYSRDYITKYYSVDDLKKMLKKK